MKRADTRPLKTLARQALAQGRLSGLHGTELRRQWRVARTLLARADAPAVLKALQLDQVARRQLLPLAPQPWSVDAALSALQACGGDATLFATLRLLQAAQPGRERLGYATHPDREAVRIDQALLLGFTGREVVELAAPRAKRPRPSVSQNALGLLGPNGAMPYAWTQHARDLQAPGGSQRSEERQSFVGFLNVLQRRQFGLLYRAWSDAQAVLGVDAELAAAEPGQGSDTGPLEGQAARHPLAARLLALAGLAHGPLPERDLIPPAFKQAFAAPLSRRVRNPAGLASMLARYFDLPVRVREFAARWLPIPKDQQTRMGMRFARLGADAVAGAQVWDCSTRFRIELGPLDLDQYRRFLPSAPAHAELRDLVALYAGPEAEWQLGLVLRASEVPVGRLNGPGQGLGWSSWLGQRRSGQDADDLQMPMRPDFASRSATA